MNIQRIQLERPNQLKSDSRDYSSSKKSQADQSKQTYTAIIFNDAAKIRPKQNLCNDRRQSIKSRQTCNKIDKNCDIEDLLTVNSLSKLINNQKDIRNSASLFGNVKLNNSIETKNMKILQRPVSAFTRPKRQVIQCLEVDQIIKECSFREGRELSLSGKNYFEDSVIKIEEKDKEKESTDNKLEQKMIQTPNYYGYIAKSRLLSSKQAKKCSYTSSNDKNISKKSIQYESAINFETLYKNLMINNRVSKSIDKNGTIKSHYFNKKHKHSIHNALKANQNVAQKCNKQNSNTLIVVSNERNSIYTLTDQHQSQPVSKNNERKCSLFTNSFHKHHSKVSLNTQILKSIKKGKNKISKMLELNKQSMVEPKLLIENVQLNKKKTIQSFEKTPSNTSHLSSQKSIAKYLTKLSCSMNKQRKFRDSDQEFRLTVQCKRVTYF